MSLLDRLTAEIATVEKHSLAGRPVKGLAISKASDVEQCAVLFIPAEYKTALKPMLKLTEKHRVLTVSDRTGFIDEGGMIELSPNAGRYVFEVNLQATRKASWIHNRVAIAANCVRDLANS